MPKRPQKVTVDEAGFWTWMMGEETPKSNGSDRKCVAPSKHESKSKSKSRRQSEHYTPEPERYTRNPYVNFLRDYRRRHTDKKSKDIVRDGAKAWKKLSEAERNHYKQLASRADRKRLGKKHGGRVHGAREHGRRRRRSSRSRSRSHRRRRRRRSTQS